MTGVRRRHLIAACGGLGLGLAAPRVARGDAPEFSYKVGTNLVATHPLNVRLQEAADQIKQDTGGKVELRIFPNSQLGSDPEMLSQVRSGGLEFFGHSGVNAISGMIPKAAISGLGFAFKDEAQVYAAMDGALGAYVRNLIKHAGLMVLDKIWDNGFRQTTMHDKPIRTPDDLKGVKLRVPPGRVWVSLFSALGASPTPISFNETYSALQTKIVDGQENALAVVDSAKLYEVQQYCSMTNHMWDGFWILCNRRAWQNLPDPAREVVAKRVDAAALLERQDVAKLNELLQSALEARGLKFNAVDPEPFRERLRKAGFYSEWKQTFGDEEWSLLEAVTGPLA